jgi:hypothetical protein
MATNKRSNRDEDDTTATTTTATDTTASDTTASDATGTSVETGPLTEPVTTHQPRTSTVHLPFVTASFTRTPGRSGVPNPLSVVAGVAGAAGDALGAAVSAVPRQKVLFYTGVAALGVAGVVEWPVAAVVVAGTYVASRSRGRADAPSSSVHTELSATTSS